ncbi:MAG: hypothetical protein K2X11_20285 [Acetobacteraceae bacterium]|nr:hypothetical protein [Acetobacteraceae bacterium]
MRALLPILLLAALPAAAQTPLPVCIPQRDGMVHCFENRLCVCRYERGGQLTGRADGYRWDCGALRPDCRPAPADLPPGMQSPWPPYLPPPHVLIDPLRR